ncbi:MAG: HAMP domain-containing protein [bacterium]|nr:HAMP domain-containing protein [bacterium]
MPVLGFRLKLLLGTLVGTVVVTGAALLAAQRSVQSAYRDLFQDGFRRDVRLVAALEDARLAAVRTRCLELARSVRLVAALGENDPPLVYEIAIDELRDVLRPPAGAAARPVSFFRLLDARGALLPTLDPRAGTLAAADDAAFALARAAALADGRQTAGILVRGRGDGAVLDEVVVTPVRDPVGGKRLGALAIGFPASFESGGEVALRAAVFAGGRLFAPGLPPAWRPAVQAATETLVADAGGADTLALGGVAHRLLVAPLHPEAPFPPAYDVGLASLAPAEAAEAQLRRRILGLGGAALLVGFVLSLGLARGLGRPIDALAAAARRIRGGDLDVRVAVRTRDEVGRLGEAFNEMAAGLALKERYRRVLDVIADAAVADELLRGGTALGGEVREVTILFCDIRGFTGRTMGMAPARLVELLNAHMTALTHVVHTHGGVVDKFIGDAVMALFGAPRPHGDDARRALRAAQAMQAERARLDAATGTPMPIGIGVASGPVVAGCVGAAERLEYTVLGDAVLLAARLAAQARPGEVLLDDATRMQAASGARVEPLAPLALKGFAAPVAAFRLAACDDAAVVTP